MKPISFYGPMISSRRISIMRDSIGVVRTANGVVSFEEVVGVDGVFWDRSWE